MEIDDYGDILGGKRKRIGRLSTAADVAAYIARCIREAERTGKVAENRDKVMMAKELLRTIESARVEKTARRENGAGVANACAPVHGEAVLAEQATDT